MNERSQQPTLTTDESPYLNRDHPDAHIDHPTPEAVERPWPWPMCKGCGNEPSACTCEQEGRHETQR
jgi:hypothetical protein